jgi:hypothetical protein
MQASHTRAPAIPSDDSQQEDRMSQNLTSDPAQNFADVLEEELRALHEQQPSRGPFVAPSNPSDPLPVRLRAIYAALHAAPEGRSALCLSGGGIRSASFSLGVVQVLARLGLLSRFDFLSTVSGGGYLGGWLSAWIKREGAAQVCAKLAEPPRKDPREPEWPPVRFLRAYSNYLSPRLGLLSADTWTLGATFLRNMLLNWCVLIPVLLVAMLVSRFFLAAVLSIPPPGFEAALWCAVAILMAVTTFYAAVDMPMTGNARLREGSFVLWRLGPLILAAFLTTIAWAWSYNVVNPKNVLTWFPEHHAWWVPFGSGGFVFPRMLLKMPGPAMSAPALTFTELLLIFVFPAVAGDVLGILYGPFITDLKRRRRFGFGYRSLVRLFRFRAWKRAQLARDPTAPQSHQQLPETLAQTVRQRLGGVFAMFFCSLIGIALVRSLMSSFDEPTARSNSLYLAAFGPALLLTVFLLLNFLLAGVTSRISKDEDREWWGRSSGWLLLTAAACAIHGTIVFWGPYWMQLLQHHVGSEGGVVGLLGLGGGLSGVFAALSGFGAKTSAIFENKRFKSALLPAGALLFLLAMDLLLAFVSERMAGDAMTFVFFADGVWMRDFHEDWPRLLHDVRLWEFHPGSYNSITPWLCLVLPAIFCGGMSLLVNINAFSLHTMYRNRLIRAFFGASNSARREHPFTGFDPRDNRPLAALSPERPLHIINTALNLVAGERLAWQERKAASFTFSRLHCGSWLLGYRNARDYSEGVTIGTAVTISGAAANPNSGYHSSPLITFLMTLFNVRLGWWLANPGPVGDRIWKSRGPRLALMPLFREALGLTDDRYRYVELSDGGHFENLGIYEMVLRRCHRILAIDGGQDRDYQFEDLGNAIRKIRIDLGIPIEIDVRTICPEDAAGKRLCCAFGRIRYSAVDTQSGAKAVRDGYLVYLKPVITGGEPADVRNYHAAHPDFPHESTNDQFFSESQLESYRALGEYTVTELAKGLSAAPTLEEFSSVIDRLTKAGFISPILAGDAATLSSTPA